MKNRPLARLALLSFAAAVAFACGKSAPPAGAGSAAPAPAGPKELHVLNWAEYFADDVLPGFEKEFGCRVIYDNFESSEGLRAKLDRVPSGYDVVFPSDEILPGLIADGKLEPLDPTKLPGIQNLASRFLAMPFDPTNAYSLPYMWGLTGIAYDTKKEKRPPDSWAVLFDPKVSTRATLLDDPREVFVSALRLDGRELETADPAAIAKAKERILGSKPKAWNSQPQSMLLAGDVTIAHMFHGDAAQVASEEGASIGFVVPKEGGTIWFDNMAIAKGSKEIDLAHAFIDYLLRPEIAAKNTNFKKYPNPNEAARPFIEKGVLENPMIYPTEADLARCRPLGALTPEARQAMLDAWADIKARGGGE